MGLRLTIYVSVVCWRPLGMFSPFLWNRSPLFVYSTYTRRQCGLFAYVLLPRGNRIFAPHFVHFFFFFIIFRYENGIFQDRWAWEQCVIGAGVANQMWMKCIRKRARLTCLLLENLKVISIPLNCVCILHHKVRLFQGRHSYVNASRSKCRVGTCTVQVQQTNIKHIYGKVLFKVIFFKSPIIFRQKEEGNCSTYCIQHLWNENLDPYIVLSISKNIHFLPLS